MVILEHELTDDTAQAFMDAYPAMISNNWEVLSLAQIESESVYQNSKGSGDEPVQFMDVLGVTTDDPESSTSSDAPSSTVSSPSR